MTTWGYLLLVVFVALGLTERVTWRKAGRYALVAVTFVVLFAVASYGGLR